MIDDYKKASQFVTSLSNVQGIKKNRTAQPVRNKVAKTFLKFLGNPQNNFKIIHVFGTSGKGSNATMIQNILTAAGHKTGIITSPHLTTMLERIKVDDKFIGPKMFTKLTKELKPKLQEFLEMEKKMPSFGLIILAIAFAYFKKKNVKYIVLEAGCGARHDYTNVVSPELSILTTISVDHTTLIGTNLEEITYEKIGGIKKDVPLFTLETKEKTLKKIKEECKKKNSLFTQIKPTFEIIKRNLTGTYFKTPKYKKLFIPMFGDHQVLNACMAIAVTEKLEIPKEAIIKGLKNSKIPARMEIMSTKPIIILDGAHNAEKMITTINAFKHIKHKKKNLILSIKSNKDVKTILNTITKEDINIIYLSFPSDGDTIMYNPIDLKKYIKKLNPKIEVKVHLESHEALKDALANTSKDDMLVITGSLHLAGELRKYWVNEKYVIKNRKLYISEINKD